jgi:hypothetical protein
VGAGPLRRRGCLMSVQRAHWQSAMDCQIAPVRSLDFVGGRPEPHHGATRHRGDAIASRWRLSATDEVAAATCTGG